MNVLGNLTVVPVVHHTNTPAFQVLHLKLTQSTLSIVSQLSRKEKAKKKKKRKFVKSHQIFQGKWYPSRAFSANTSMAACAKIKVFQKHDQSKFPNGEIQR